jgi:hypothetical protein
LLLRERLSLATLPLHAALQLRERLSLAALLLRAALLLHERLSLATLLLFMGVFLLLLFLLLCCHPWVYFSCCSSLL